MLKLPIEYAKNELHASRITLGVFANNDSAKYCNESVGFQPMGEIVTYKMSIGEWECIEMELLIDKQNQKEYNNQKSNALLF